MSLILLSSRRFAVWSPRRCLFNGPATLALMAYWLAPAAYAALMLVLVCSLLASKSSAEIVRLKLTGKVAISGSSFNVLPDDLAAGADTDIFQPPNFNAPGGKRFVAYWSYDTSVPDAAPDLTYSGIYRHPLADPITADFGLSVHIDDYVFRMDTSADPYSIHVGVGRLTPPDFLGRGDGIGTGTAEVVVPFEYDSPTIIDDNIALSIGDSIFAGDDASSLSSDSLPRSLDISEFDYAFIQIAGAGETFVGSTPPPSYFIKAWINQIEVVPEPSATCLALFLATMLSRRGGRTF